MQRNNALKYWVLRHREVRYEKGTRCCYVFIFTSVRIATLWQTGYLLFSCWRSSVGVHRSDGPHHVLCRKTSAGQLGNFYHCDG